MDIKEIRLANLKALITRYGTHDLLAEHIDGTAPAQISHWVTKRRNIGEKSARKIEEGCGLDSLWMDKIHKGEVETPITKKPLSEIQRLADKMNESQFQLFLGIGRMIVNQPTDLAEMAKLDTPTNK